MKCPHCLTSFHHKIKALDIEADVDRHWRLLYDVCPNCMKIVIQLGAYHPKATQSLIESFLVYPRGISRSPLSDDVPEKFAEDYREACLVLSNSPKASAALSRRCLQNLVREAARVKPSNLSNEIDELLSSGGLPSYLADGIDAIRNIGNFAAHPIKSTNTGEIVGVEPGEAEWLLDLLERFFDFYFVQPAILNRKREALNKKLTDAGKPPMK